MVLLRETMNLKFKITASYFGSQEILTTAHMPLELLPFTEFLSMFECKDSNSALVISFIPFKNFAVTWMDAVRVFFRHVVGLPTLLAARAGSCSTLLELRISYRPRQSDQTRKSYLSTSYPCSSLFLSI